ncbi:MAG: CCA tRNA nucleotidyltransferase [Mediterraneibacter gnavus]
MKINIPSDANELIHTLQNHGNSAYVVGGCVRDSIIGRQIHDWDICTSATPDEMLEIFKDKKVIETGLKHGTITVVVKGESYELTTFRIDGKYSDNRRPDSVIFTSSLIEDLKRRDFTINAMAYNDDEGLIDPFGGLEDIEYKKIQCVGSAKDRFGEDALRILRAIRFASQLEFVITPETSYEINKQYKNLKNISIERINSEFCKIAASRDFCVEMVLYKDVFALFIPELKDMFEFQQNNPYHDYDVYSHTVHSIEHCKFDNLVVRLAVFFHDIGKPHSFQDGEDGIRHFKGHGKVSADITDNIMKRLKFDNETRNNVVELVYYHDATFEVGKKYVRRWINKIGVEQFRRLLEVRKADILGQKEFYEQYRINKVNNIKQILEEVLQEETCFTLKDLAVNGNDLMSIGYKENKELGNTLNELLRLVIDEECPNKKEKLLEVAIERRM